MIESLVRFLTLRNSKNNKLCLIGHFGGSKDFFDGQTVKTRIIYTELKKTASFQIFCVDTYYKSSHPFKLLLQSIYYLTLCRYTIILPSTNGRKFFFPLLYFFSKIFKKKIFHIITGGYLPEQLLDYPKWLKYINSFEVNWIQFKSACDKLTECGVRNAEVLHNFKNLSIVKEDELPVEHFAPYRFCTFSRISVAKGIPDAIRAVDAVNEHFGYEIASLDIYGQPDADYGDEFAILMETVSDAIKYKGTVPYDQSTGILKNYFALLFPTFFNGEGFAGTIIDAFSSGLPVIATDWHANAEIIENGVTGIIYPDNAHLYDSILYAVSNPEIIHAMRPACIWRAGECMPERHIKQIIDKIQNNA